MGSVYQASKIYKFKVSIKHTLLNPKGKNKLRIFNVLSILYCLYDYWCLEYWIKVSDNYSTSGLSRLQYLHQMACFDFSLIKKGWRDSSTPAQIILVLWVRGKQEQTEILQHYLISTILLLRLIILILILSHTSLQWKQGSP